MTVQKMGTTSLIAAPDNYFYNKGSFFCSGLNGPEIANALSDMP
jgi:hypothetical protein